jgi:hypothetical protein
VYSSQPASQNVYVIESDSNHVIFACANILVSVWHGSQEPDVCHRLYSVARDLAKRSRAGKVAALSVIMQSTSAPSPATREALARLHQDPDHVIHRSALVLAKSGFVASIVRSVVLGLRQRASRLGSHEVFSSAAEALEWITQDLPTAGGAPIETGAILAELDRLQAQRTLVA